LAWAHLTTFWLDGRLSLGHYRDLWGQTAHSGRLLWNTFRVCGVTVATSLLLGVPLGLVLFRSRLPLRRLWITIVAVSPLVPMPVVAGAWLAACGLQGALTPALKWVFHWVGVHFTIYSVWGAGWILGTAYAPLTALVTGLSVSLVPRVLEEDGLLDGSRGRVALWVTLRESLPGIVGAAALVLALSAANMAVTDVLVVRTFAETTYSEFQLHHEPARIVALSTPVTAVMTAAIAAVLLWTLKRHRERYGSEAADVAPKPLLAGDGRALLFTVAVLTLYPGLPMASLVAKVGSVAVLADSLRVAWEELVNSVALSAAAATLAVAAALPLAAAARRGGASAWILLWVGFALALPAPIVGIALIQVFNRPNVLGWFYDSPGILVAASLTRFLPFGVMACLPAVSAVPPDLEAAATLDGAGPWRRLVAIVAPLCGRAMGVAWLLVFVLSMGELGASVLVAPPGRATLAVRIFTLLHYGVDDALAGICLVLLAAAGLPLLVAAALWRPQRTG